MIVLCIHDFIKIIMRIIISDVFTISYNDKYLSNMVYTVLVNYYLSCL